jgi:hypothetical protein
VKNQWKNESLKQALGSYGGFCELLGLDKVQKYLIERRVHTIADWGSTDLDAEGLALQAELEQRQSVWHSSNAPVVLQSNSDIGIATSGHQVFLDLLGREDREELASLPGVLHTLAGWFPAYPSRAAQILEVCNLVLC